MKASVLVSALAASLVSIAPAHASNSDLLEACAKSFAVSNFDTSRFVVRFENDYNFGLPLMFRSQPARVKLVALSRTSLRSVPSALCTSKKGVVTVEGVTAVETVAAR